MSCSTREFGKCVKTQLQLVCSNYDSREFISISLLIKRDFLIWINTARKGVFERLEAGLCRGRMPMGCWRCSRSGAALGSSPIPGTPGLANLPGRGKWLCQVSCGGSKSLVDGSGQALQLKITNNKPQTKKSLGGTTLDARDVAQKPCSGKGQGAQAVTSTSLYQCGLSREALWDAGCLFPFPRFFVVLTSCHIAWSCSCFSEQEEIVVLTGEQLGKG